MFFQYSGYKSVEPVRILLAAVSQNYIYSANNHGQKAPESHHTSGHLH